jgi:predicted amidohydrolase
VDVRSHCGTTPLQLYAANTDHLKRRLAEAQAAGAKLYVLPEFESDGKFGGSVIKELEARAVLAMMKLLVERGADVEAVYPKWDPVNSRDVRY